MKITFYGAAQKVTGSKHLIETNELKILLDCGLHQGRRRETNKLNSAFSFDPSEIDAVILSHGHADHCGMLPLLIKQGFKGKIYATPATVDVAGYIMQDSAKLQEQDTSYHNDHLRPGEEPITPLYTAEDVEQAIAHFVPVPYFWHTKTWTRLSPHIRFKLYDAGHILGSSIVLVEITENEHIKTIAFTGDIGHKDTPLLRDPEMITEPVNILISECTYGNRVHQTLEEAKVKLAQLITLAFEHKSKIIVPSFSLGRTQELIYILHQLTDKGAIPRLPIYIDSPLAANLGDVFIKHADEYNQATWQDFAQPGETPLAFRNLEYTHSVEDSKRLNTLSGPFMVISASGMCEGGRVVHHIKNNIADPHAIIMFTGYQAEGTLGRKIIEGINPVKIMGEEYPVLAHVVKFNEFSAHADQAQLLEYIQNLHGLETVFLVHTEEGQATTFAPLLKDKMPTVDIIIPKLKDSFNL